MSEEIEVIKYLMTNIQTHKIILKSIYNNKEAKDYLYDFIRYQMREYAKFNVSLKRMLELRVKKINGTKNAVISIATNIRNNNINNEKECLIFLKEAAKVNIMDIGRIRENYNIKSKNILNLIKRLENFERKNLEMIESFR